MLSIGCILRHDFSEEIPEMFSAEDFNCCLNGAEKELSETAESKEGNERYKDKYVVLLQQYNQLLLDSYTTTAYRRIT